MTQKKININKDSKTKRKYEFKTEKSKKRILYSLLFGLLIAVVACLLATGIYKLYANANYENVTKNANATCSVPYNYNNCRYAKNNSVKKLQQMLNKLGYYKDSFDGNFGSNTVKAVQRFQRNNYLRSTGQINALTLMRIVSKAGGQYYFINYDKNGGAGTLNYTYGGKWQIVIYGISTQTSTTKLDKVGYTHIGYRASRTSNNGTEYFGCFNTKCNTADDSLSSTPQWYTLNEINNKTNYHSYIYTIGGTVAWTADNRRTVTFTAEYCRTGQTYNKSTSSCQGQSVATPTPAPSQDSGSVSLNITSSYPTSVIKNTRVVINGSINNGTNSNVYYKWKTYTNGNLAWNDDDCNLARSHTTAYTNPTLLVNATRKGNISVYSNSSCTNLITSKDTNTYYKIEIATYKQSNSSWANSSFGCKNTNFKHNGCFPTAVAIAAKTLTGTNDNPKNIANNINSNGQYCNQYNHLTASYVKAAANYYGFETSNYIAGKYSSYDDLKTTITNTLSTGRSILIAQLYCKTSKGSALCSCSNCGHSVVVYPSSDNNYINYSDPNTGGLHTATLSELVNNIRQSYSDKGDFGYYVLTKK